MNVKGKHYLTIWMKNEKVMMIDQNQLPFRFEIFESKNYAETCLAIKTMIVRGAGAIGAAAGFAMAQAFIQAKENILFAENARKEIETSRPTARNLFYATKRVFDAGCISTEKAIEEAQKIAEEDIASGKMIGIHGNSLIKDNTNILTHCNAGWLGFVDYGSALSPIYTASKEGKNIFVYADETRPRGQGARLTAWELNNENIPHIIIPDNAGAYLASKGKIDTMICGADRIAANGDTANKIGTFEKAIVAKTFGIPFYIAAPLSTFDINCCSGEDIIIEERTEDEILYQTGLDENNELRKILVCSPGSKAYNPAFDVTPASYINGFITEKGIIPANETAIKNILS
ncbi:MAG: S-methyl-5-thioribose-1-phosphate isomerase [Bacteroidetes bacterium]|nr:S-methyl-5-thioribose-1-phosphate isomerase [Bacteroidota bacterium]